MMPANNSYIKLSEKEEDIENRLSYLKELLNSNPSKYEIKDSINKLFNTFDTFKVILEYNEGLNNLKQPYEPDWRSSKEEYELCKKEWKEYGDKLEEYEDNYPTLFRLITKECNDYIDNRSDDIRECFELIKDINDKESIYNIIKEHLIKRFNREELIFS
jgi:uncharacterized coiled-coil DUF342 family protein